MAAKKAGKTKTPVRKRTPAGKPRGRTVAEFMTRSPHTIGRDQTLALAHELMRKYRIRHLPVLEGGQLIGLVSQRDLYFVEALDGSAPERVTVAEAMTQDVFAVAAATPLERVVETMISKKHGCAVISDGGKVAGVFSTIDGLRALLQLSRKRV